MAVDNCPRCGESVSPHGLDEHWLTREGYRVCPDLVRPDLRGQPEWHIGVVLRELERMRAVVEAARAVDGDWCDGFNTTEFGCTCPAHELMARVREADRFIPNREAS